MKLIYSVKYVVSHIPSREMELVSVVFGYVHSPGSTVTVVKGSQVRVS